MKTLVMILGATLVAAAPLSAFAAQATSSQSDAQRLAADKARATAAERAEPMTSAEKAADAKRLASDKARAEHRDTDRLADDKARAMKAERNEKMTPAEMKADQARLAADKAAAAKRKAAAKH